MGADPTTRRLPDAGSYPDRHACRLRGPLADHALKRCTAIDDVSPVVAEQ